MADKKTADDVTKPVTGVQTPDRDEAQIEEGLTDPENDQATTEEVDAADQEHPVSETETDDVPAEESQQENAEPVREIERIVEKRGGFGAALLGGAVAAVIGFVVGQGGLLNSVLPASLQGTGAVDMAAYDAEQAALKDQLAALQAQIDTVKLPDVAPLEQRLGSLETALDDLSEAQSAAPESAADIAALVTRVDQLETRPITDAASPEAVAAFEAELAKLQDSLAAQRGEVETMLAEAREMELASAEAARVAAAQTALAKIRATLDTGGAYLAAIAELETQQVDVPTALRGSAETGVVTLAGLRDAFTPAARDALALAREETKGSGGLMDYVNRHLGARSTTPQAGDGADAVLSRAEAAVHAGTLDLALDELYQLPDAARVALDDWQASARARLAALAAVDQLAQSLNAK
ncbi:hypothetical protein PH5382_00502 [Phaeobacter sp. CECT 5382]|uniref:COG4223 family protein n=1 Tax=Phaeobacter sp. CECT 5382 TaxID=1712645 RepID=UPI0006DA4C09|nr:hypothetical protein [Phaeobacter sp. CECT 5382]CUH86589.1 hypothetical protein PH5382_00502 [Phaeobacter sp. CECT 5382]